MRKRIGVGVIAALAAVMLVVAPVASAKDGDVRRSGGCSAASDWKLKLSMENGKIEVEYEIDQNKVGQKWRVTLKHDGKRFFRGVRETKAPSGSFEVRKLTGNHSGEDRFVGRAVNLKSDETCKGSARI